MLLPPPSWLKCEAAATAPCSSGKTLTSMPPLPPAAPAGACHLAARPSPAWAACWRVPARTCVPRCRRTRRCCTRWRGR
jgi:hypothetical protein